MLLLLIAVTVFISSTTTDGSLVYPLDDTYTGMAMAKNFALHGVLGITPHEFTSSSSTPLFTLILSACYKATGPLVAWPLVLATAFSICSLFAADRIVSRFLSGTERVLALLAVAVLTPLHTMSVLGMEHSLHIMFTLIFVDAVARKIENSAASSRTLLIAAPLMVATRYEGLFVVAVACLLLLRKAPGLAVKLGLVALAPVILYGALSFAKGWYWLPNSIAMKGVAGRHLAASLIEHLVFIAPRAWYLAVIAAVLAAGAWLVRRRSAYLASIGVMSAGAICIHLLLADVGWGFRYEAYLLAVSVAGLSCMLLTLDALSWRLIVSLLLCLLAYRSVRATRDSCLRSAAIYSQQVQMAHFIHDYFDGSAVALNDIGAVNYFSDVKCLDLVGLANKDVFFAKRTHTYTTQLIDTEARRMGVRIAAVYDDWFGTKPAFFGGPPLPPQWIRVERWKVDDRGGRLGSGMVSFYAVEPEAADHLTAALAAFRARLPKGVEVLPGS